MSKGNIQGVFNEHFDDILNPKPRIFTGFKGLDDCLRGIRLSDFPIIAGVTGDFKSTLSANILMNAYRQKNGVCMYNYEMSNLQTLRRIICAELNMPLHIVESAGSNKQVKKLEKALKDSNIWLQDKDIDNIDELLINISKKTESGVQLNVIDYVQLISAPGKGNRVEQIEYVARKIRRSAITHNVVNLGISQLSRAHKSNGTKADLHDLKGSGGLENDATQVIFIETKRYNELLENRSDVFIPSYREATLSIKKNRHGVSRKDIKCLVRPDLYKFINVDYKDDIGEDNCEEAACENCNSESFFVDDQGNCYCGKCNTAYTKECEACNESGYIEYTKSFDGITYSYMGFCSHCGRGKGVLASIKATNSVIDTPEDKISYLPFVRSQDISMTI